MGFLAEAESSEVDCIVDALVDRSFTVEERFTIEVILRDCGPAPPLVPFAVNEVSIEKASRERMLEVLVEVDGRPLSRWACDGVLVSTPTGSTAYAFSAGGPVVWPGVDAILVVPLSAHALFARPLVLSPTSTVVVELIDVSRPTAWSGATVAGRRSCAPGWRSRSPAVPTGSGWPGCRRPRSPTGWCTSSGYGSRAARGRPTLWSPDDARRAADRRPRRDQRGHARAAPGLTVVTGETGAGKTMVVTGLGLLLGGRADPKAVRRGADRARVEGRFAVADRPDSWSRVAAGAEFEDGELLVSRHVTAAGRSRACLGGAQCRPGSAPRDRPTDHHPRPVRADPARHGGPPARAAGPVRRGRCRARLDRYRAGYAERRSAGAELDRLRSAAQARAREVDLLRFGLAEIEQVDPEPGEDVALAAEARRLSQPTTCDRPRPPRWPGWPAVTTRRVGR